MFNGKSVGWEIGTLLTYSQAFAGSLSALLILLQKLMNEQALVLLLPEYFFEIKHF